ncbi:MAG: hypothetical protein ACFFCX_08335, partial [Candidatus Sifarchaeia archaeon]
MNIIRKGGIGTVNEIKKKFRRTRSEDELIFDVGRMNRDLLKKMLVVCGRVGNKKADQYQRKAKDLESDFIIEKGRSWVLTHKTVKENYDQNYHKGVLLIGTNKELPATQISYDGVYA